MSDSLWPLIALGFPDSSVGKESTCKAGDPCSIPGLGRSPGEGIGYPFQYSWASLVSQLAGKVSTCNAGDLGLIPRLGISPGGEHGNPLSKESGSYTGVGSHSLLQGNFPTQESNWGLLHCRRILYQLRYSSNRLVIQLTHCKVLYVLEIYIGKWITNIY